ncbi:pantoate--beta-alanine ligase [Bacteroidota bacterium]
MKIVRSISETRTLIKTMKGKTGTLGFVPTMGSLHDGHMSLVRKSIEENDASIVSIFVNPTQFNEKQDFELYPRNLNEDLKVLGQHPVDLVFVPSSDEIYPEPDTREFDFEGLESVMEGKHRPGHFKGVAQIVSKLLEIVQPDVAYFGKKDFQQLAIIRKLVEIIDLPVRISGCPIIRESDGLAMSSRNKLLLPEERSSAARIFEGLFKAGEEAGKTTVEELINSTIQFLHQDPRLKVEYFEIVDASYLKPVQKWTDNGRKIGCIAVQIGNVRLIDNMEFSS